MSALRRDEGGQTIVLIASVLAVLLLAVGLAVDAGQLYVNRRSAQIAADSAAWAGAVILFDGGNASLAISAANADAAKNGYSSGLTVNSPPVTGNAVGDPFFIEVTISQAVTPTFFTGSRTLSVRAVAGATRSGTGDGVVVLDPTSSNTLTMANTSSLSVTGSGVMVQSSNNSAINIAALPGITSPPSSYNRAVGSGSTSSGVLGRITPTLVPHVTPLPTPSPPFPRLPGPPVSTAPPLGCPLAGGGTDCNNVTATLLPGIYAGGIKIRGNSTVTLNPGVYILKGGGGNFGLQVQNTASVGVAGTAGGVLIFNTSSSYPASGSSCGNVDLNTTGTVTLRAQTVGSYAGIVLFQDANCTNQVQFRSTGTKAISGTIYLPGATFNFSGGVAQSMSAQLVVNQYTSSVNNSALNLTFDPSKVAGGRVPALIE